MSGKAHDEECVVVATSVALFDRELISSKNSQLRDYLVAARVCARSLVHA
jgi:hypothetical protein